MAIDTHSLTYLPRRSSKKCDMQFANIDRQTGAYTDLRRTIVQVKAFIRHYNCEIVVRQVF